MAEWFEEFFDGLYAKVLPKTFEEPRTLEHARIVKRLLDVRKGQRVLDIPCGMGRLTIPLARMGLVMTGVDLTESYLRRARRRARREGLDVCFVHCDMRDIDFDKEFNAAFNWFGSFGYFSDAENLSFSRKVFQALKPGGRFLVEGMNKSWIVAHFRTRDDSTHGGVRVSRRNRWETRTSRAISTWTLSKGNMTERHRLSIRMFNGTEMRCLLRAAGFRDIEFFGYPPVGRFTRHSRRLIAVGRRPAK